MCALVVVGCQPLCAMLHVFSLLHGCSDRLLLPSHLRDTGTQCFSTCTSICSKSSRRPPVRMARRESSRASHRLSLTQHGRLHLIFASTNSHKLTQAHTHTLPTVDPLCPYLFRFAVLTDPSNQPHFKVSPGKEVVCKKPDAPGCPGACPSHQRICLGKPPRRVAPPSRRHRRR